MFAGGQPFRVLAPAKINLYLEVLGRRPDGYHNLRSLVTPIALCDEVTLEPTDGPIEVHTDVSALPRTGPVDGLDGDANLAARAARLLRERTGHRGGARVGITKHIPIGGGLGGGSADAAATLRGLNLLWGTGVPEAELMALGGELGCDVPALVCGRTVSMEGKGERIAPLGVSDALRTREWWLVVGNPGVSVPTRDIYRRFKLGLTPPPETFNNIRLALERGDVELAGGSLFNALQATVMAKYPLLALLAEALRRAGGVGVLLSGSGAALFARARDRGHAQAIEDGVRQATGPWLWSRVVRMLPDGVIGSTRPFGG